MLRQAPTPNHYALMYGVVPHSRSSIQERYSGCYEQTQNNGFTVRSARHQLAYLMLSAGRKYASAFRTSNANARRFFYYIKQFELLLC